MKKVRQRTRSWVRLISPFVYVVVSDCLRKQSIIANDPFIAEVFGQGSKQAYYKLLQSGCAYSTVVHRINGSSFAEFLLGIRFHFLRRELCEHVLELINLCAADDASQHVDGKHSLM
jgi:hypothetical protein